jgi:signal peptidase I
VNDRSLADYRRAAHEALQSANPIGPLRLHVISDSMRPLLKSGDGVVVQPIEPAAGRVGDVLVVQRGAELVTHRLIDVTGESWVLRGDNAIFADAPVARNDCIGRVIAIERGARRTDLTQPPWPSLNDRLGRLGRAHWRMTRLLRLSSSSPRWLIKLARLAAIPFRVVTHLMLAQS